MDTTTVLVRYEAGVATVILNRPQVLNTLNPELVKTLYAVLQRLSADQNVRCVVMQGAGEHFMAGGDIAYFRESLPSIQQTHGEDLKDFFHYVHGVIELIQSMPKPVIASVRGAAVGFGLSLVLACDLVIASNNAKFTTAYCLIGLSPDGGMSYLLPRLVGEKVAKELLFLGERFDAERALHLGLINELVGVDELQHKTQQLAARLCRSPQQALAATKQLIHASRDGDLSAHLLREETAFIAASQTDDFAEGVHAFCDKRKPVFS